jgi:predicted glycosyltransferase
VTVRAWIDIENPPQVQYQLPFKELLEAQGADVVVTARDTFGTVELLRQRGISHKVIGRPSRRKTVSSLARAAQLLGAFTRSGRPDLMVAGSRAAALACWIARVPCFTFVDYEYVHLSLYPRLRTYVLHPRLIPAAFFVDRGLSPTQLIAFEGLKEDLTFADLDLDAIQPYVFPEDLPDGFRRVLFRPPAEDSHYYRASSGELSRDLLRYLARQADSVVVFSPRTAEQLEYLEGIAWQQSPMVLREPVPALPLLKAVDLVISGGGTMTREAAYLGVPAWSLFQNEIGKVDEYLSSLGRLRLVREGDEFPQLPARGESLDPIPDRHPGLGEELTQLMLARIG